ncbi:MAG: dTMP kinase [Patescibacteria group bacterium]
MGKLIVFEGGEFVGKSTQVKLLAKRLEVLGKQVIVTREPGGTPEGMALRKKLLAGGLLPKEELNCFLEGRRLHVNQVILPELAQDSYILCDRFSGSTYVYQHIGRGLPLDGIRTLDAEARKGVIPDVEILLDMDPQVAFVRHETRKEELTTFEKENLDFHKKIRQGYLNLFPFPFVREIIRADQTIEQVSKDIWTALEKRNIFT